MNDDENKTLKKKQKKSNQIIMVTYNEVPKYQQDNEYIRKGYLKNCDSIKKVFKSLFMIHNETVNIWSHLLGAILINCLIIYTAFFITNYKTHYFDLTNSMIKFINKPQIVPKKIPIIK